ncbi:MAG: hypothetical protein LBF60_09050 [Treponema sp.]|jgi:hypothetical protein|nr:hypothetical protein [Treponema sp.]
MTGREIVEAAEESYAYVDIAGCNYLDVRYEMDGKLYPNRIILGTETYPRSIAGNWRLVQDNFHVLGEVGIGKVDYSGGPQAGFHFFLAATPGVRLGAATSTLPDIV